MNAYITSIGCAVPEVRIPQSHAREFLLGILPVDGLMKKKINAVYRLSGIETRYSVVEDYGPDALDNIFVEQSEVGAMLPRTSKRMDIYKREAPILAQKAIDNCLAKHNGFKPQSITHLITVSCTGMYAPGIDLDILGHYGLSGSIHRTQINFMGCYAAINAMKVACSICKSEPNAKTLVVCVELCSIHLQEMANDDQILSGALFGDGAVAFTVENKPTNAISLELSGFYCDVMPQGKKDMAWDIGDFGFEMRLSSYVPQLVENGAFDLIQKLKSTLDISDIQHWAIHPGGKKIVQAAQEALQLNDSQVSHSFEILRKYGNMSSPTVVFVLNEILERLNNTHYGNYIVALAFGPGLTLESALLKITNHYAGL